MSDLRIIILALALAGAVSFALGWHFPGRPSRLGFPYQCTGTQTEAPTATIIDSRLPSGWKRYTSTQYGFAISYPEGASVDEGSASGVSITVRGPTQKKASEFYDGVKLKFTVGALRDTSLKQFVYDKVSSLELPSMLLSGPETVIIGGLPAYLVRIGGYGQMRVFYLSVRTGCYLEIVDLSADPTQMGFRQLADRMLNSMSFLR